MVICYMYGFGQMVDDISNIRNTVESAYENFSYKQTKNATVKNSIDTNPSVNTTSYGSVKETNADTSKEPSNSVQQSYDDIDQSYNAIKQAKEEERRKYEESLSPRQRIKNRIANLSVQYNMIGADEIGKKAVLKLEIDSLIQQLSEMDED